MKSPLHYRKEIPFFYDKSETEFQQDTYERYDPMVLRQTALHLADEIWGGYSMQAILDFAEPYLPIVEAPAILEIGCSTGRWVATLAKKYPKATCWGMDYSYQMLKQAKAYWVSGGTIYLDCSAQGYSTKLELKGHRLKNLRFGLTKASDLPFDTNSQTIILHSFLLDRLEDLKKSLTEMHRVLVPGGKMIFVTPLNFLKSKHWEEYYPPIKIHQLLIQLGFEIKEWQEDLMIHEPLDVRGNSVCWKCIGVVLEKKE